jgi:hypothetical protein
VEPGTDHQQGVRKPLDVYTCIAFVPAGSRALPTLARRVRTAAPPARRACGASRRGDAESPLHTNRTGVSFMMTSRLTRRTPPPAAGAAVHLLAADRPQPG